MSDSRRPDEPDESDRPLPEPIRFFGTTWVDHTGGYALRRVGVGLGALVLAAAGAYALKLAYEGVAIAETGEWIRLLMVLAFAICTSIGFVRTLTRFSQPLETEEDEERDRSMRSFMLVGFVGVLLAFAVRSVIEAPGEKLHREEYDAEVQRWERRRTSRTGNPAKRKRKRKR